VCHSLGGIIARCAIMRPEMDLFRYKFESFITLSTPHLSLLFNKNTTLNTRKYFNSVRKNKKYLTNCDYSSECIPNCWKIQKY
jgi:hypothetical protein